MKMTRIGNFRILLRWLFRRTETDDGATGWDEPELEGRAEVVRAEVRTGHA